MVASIVETERARTHCVPLRAAVSSVLLAALAAAPAAGAQNRGGEVLEEVVVTGEKFARSRQDTVASVAVTTGEEIDQRPIADLYDVIKRVPNIVASEGGFGFAIRGIDQRGLGGSGSGQTLTLYVDDAALTSNWATFLGPTDTWDLAQVEVFRGPQSTVQGRNALAGAIIMRTADPTYDWEGKIRADAYKYDGYQIAGAFGGPIVDERLAFRVAANLREDDGFIDNTFRNEPANPTRLQSFRGKLLFDPTDNLSALLTVSRTDNERGVDVLNKDTAFDRQVAWNHKPFEGSETTLSSLNVTWNINDQLDLQSVTAYQRTIYIQKLDVDWTPDPTGTYDRYGTDKSLSQEVRLLFDGDRIDAIAGAYYLKADIYGENVFTNPLRNIAPAAPLDNTWSQASVTNNDTETWAVFGDAAINIAGPLSFLVGVRYNAESQDDDAYVLTEVLGDLAPEWEFVRTTYGSVVTQPGRSGDFNAFLWKGGFKMEWTPDLSTTLLAQKGYRGGGTQVNSLTGQVTSYDDEYLYNYELSVRSMWLGGRLRANGNIFYGDWENQQVSVPIDPLVPRIRQIINAGTSKLYGIEGDLAYHVSNALQLYGSFSWMRTKFVDFPFVSGSEVLNYRGNSFPFAPEYSVNVGFDWSHTSGFFIGADVTRRDGMHSQPTNLPANKTDAYTLVDMRAGLARDSWRATLYASNLLDEEYFTYLLGAQGSVGDPRVYGLRFDYGF